MTTIVGIGASAGGLEALEEFFSTVETDIGYAYVVLQHLSPDFKSHMDELLERQTTMRVRQIEDGDEIRPDTVFLNPPRKNCIIERDKFRLIAKDDSGGLNMPIDVCLRSMAQSHGDKVIAVVLSGTGSDGSRGIVDVKRSGGLVCVQDPDTAAFDGMPKNAIATATADIVARPRELAKALSAHKAGDEDLKDFSAGIEVTNRDDPPEYARLLRTFRVRYGVDFAFYKPTTFNRRVERRMKLAGYRRLESFIDHLCEDDDACESMYRDLLVEVTEFFRDGEAFQRLEQEIVPDLVKNASDDEVMRAWIAGCATGEEAYSIAMLLDEAIEAAGRNIQLKVFATDIHQRSLEAASAGVFKVEACDGVSQARQQRYLEQRNGLYYVRPELRKSVIFATHDLTRDPPFTKVDLISCRNVLIYLKPQIQERVLKQFHFGLRKGGYLFLGASETVGEMAPEFTVVDQRWRMYQKRRDVRMRDGLPAFANPSLRRVIGLARTPLLPTAQRDSERDVQIVMQKIASDILPNSLLVDENYELARSFGSGAKLLQQPSGRPTLDVLSMLPGSLRTIVNAALHRSAKSEHIVQISNVLDDDDEGRRYSVEVRRYPSEEKVYFLISIDTSVAGESAKATQPVPASVSLEEASAEVLQIREDRVDELERELAATREILRSTVEDLEASNEELQSTNEELVAANEELQSTNEELHSVNEELYTVNSEHQRKIAELTEVSADLDNLLCSTEIGTVFLDEDLNIRSFTSAVTNNFHILDRDVGRPVAHIAPRFDDGSLLERARDVLETGEVKEAQVRTDEGRWFIQRVTPYRESDARISGVVLTFVPSDALASD